MSQNEKRPFLVELDFEPKTYDIDFAGVVSNIVYTRWLEDLRLASLKAHMPLDALMRDGLAPTLASSRVEYRRPLRLFEAVKGSMWTTGVDERRWRLSAEFVRASDGQRVVRAEQVAAIVDLKTARAVAVPENVQAKWREENGLPPRGEESPATPEPAAWLAWIDARTGEKRSAPVGYRSTDIGNGPRCEVVLGDPAAAQSRVRIRNSNADNPKAKPDFELLDFGSRNSVLLNGKKLENIQALHDGDTIRVGETDLAFSLRKREA